MANLFISKEAENYARCNAKKVKYCTDDDIKYLIENAYKDGYYAGYSKGVSDSN